MLDVINDFKIKTTDDTLNLVLARIANKKNQTEDSKKKASAKAKRLHNSDPKYFAMYVRLFAHQKSVASKKKTGSLSKQNEQMYKNVLGLSSETYTQNNVNLAHTKKTNGSPKSYRKYKEAHAKLTKHLNQSIQRI